MLSRYTPYASAPASGPAMTAPTLPNESSFCFWPAYGIKTEVQQIRTIIEGRVGKVATALITIDLNDALRCDTLNRRRELDRGAWTSMATASMAAASMAAASTSAVSMSAETPEPGDSTAH